MQNPHCFSPLIEKLRFLSILFISLLSVFAVTSAHAGSQDLKYTYDALGRVKTVEDNLNTNRNYTYDAAGNRTDVTIGNVVSSAASSSASSSHPLICPTPAGAPFLCNTPNSTSYAHWAYCNDWCARN